MSLHLEHLNPEQLAAVTLPEGHALILAGAGSGKTRVLTTRIAWLLKAGAVSPSGVLAVTFTNKAAREMLTRLTAMLTLSPRGMWIGTFHGLCNRMLRAHYQEAGLPREFQILDTQDQLAAVKRLLRSMNADEDRFRPFALEVLTLRGALISEVDAFVTRSTERADPDALARWVEQPDDPEQRLAAFGRFGLPERLD